MNKIITVNNEIFINDFFSVKVINEFYELIANLKRNGTKLIIVNAENLQGVDLFGLNMLIFATESLKLNDTKLIIKFPNGNFRNVIKQTKTCTFLNLITED